MQTGKGKHVICGLLTKNHAGCKFTSECMPREVKKSRKAKGGLFVKSRGVSGINPGGGGGLTTPEVLEFHHSVEVAVVSHNITRGD